MERGRGESGGGARPGDVLAGKYEIERELGGGGMGVVFAARHRELDREVALKVMRAEAAAEPDLVRRFLREARAASKIESPHVAKVLDAGELDDGAPYLVLELLEGEDLAAYLAREGRAPIERAIAWILEACEGVAAAHDAGIVHRDLKPANLFLATLPDGSRAIKVLDFGVSKLLEAESDGELTESRVVMGSPAYMAPEQMVSSRDADARSDVFSLGAVLHALLVGAPPFPGATLVEIHAAIRAGARPLRRARPDASPELESVVARALERDPAARFATVRELADALARASSTTASEHPRPESLAPPTEPVETDATLPAASTARARASLVGGALVAGALLAATAVIVVGARRDPPAPPPSPLDAPTATLACPILEARGVAEPVDWLGATAGALACRRAVWRLGGSTSRARPPADLLELPKTPSEKMPNDPWAGADVRAKTLARARSVATAYLDGSVAKVERGFDVKLTLVRASDRSVLGEAAGSAIELDDAVAAAIAALPALPRPSHLDPRVAAFLGFDDPIAGALVDDAFLHPDRCPHLVERAPSFGPFWCAYAGVCATGADDDQSHSKTALIDSSPAALALTAPAWVEENEDVAPSPLVERLARARESEPSALGRARLAMGIGGVWFERGALDRAYDAYLLAASDAPAQPIVWSQLLATASNPAPVMRAGLAWAPDLEELVAGLVAQPSLAIDEKLRLARRAFELFGDRGDLGEAYGRALVEAGRREEARSVAAALTSSSRRRARVLGTTLAARIEIDEGDFAAAEARLLGVVQSSDDYGDHQLVAQLLFQLAPFLGDGGRASDVWVERAITSGALAKSPHEEASIQVALVGCLHASKPALTRALASLRDLRARSAAAWGASSTSLFEGLERISAGDVRGAADRLRALAADPGLARFLPEELFDAAGAPELADRVADAEALGTRFHGIPRGTERRAMRARERGDDAEAEQLAQSVERAWGSTRPTLPAVEALRRAWKRSKKRADGH